MTLTTGFGGFSFGIYIYDSGAAICSNRASPNSYGNVRDVSEDLNVPVKLEKMETSSRLIVAFRANISSVREALMPN